MKANLHLVKKPLCALILAALLAFPACSERVDVSTLTPSDRVIGAYSFYYDSERTYALYPDSDRVKLSFDGDIIKLAHTGFHFITDSSGNILTDDSLEPLTDFKLGNCFENSSGQIVFLPYGRPAKQWYVTDSFRIVRPSREFDEVLGIHEVFAAVIDDGNLRIMSLDGDQLADLGAMPEGMYLRELMYQSDTPTDQNILPSYYVLLTDSTDIESESKCITYEFDPNSGEVTSTESEGIIYG